MILIIDKKMNEVNVTSSDTTPSSFTASVRAEVRVVSTKKPKKERITSIDALRAVTLLGILLTHTRELFGWVLSDVNMGVVGQVSSYLIEIILSNRCNTIFGILFGVSFYLILRNPSYSTRKFIWRCFLLMVYGIFIKIFYTYDALMWYGICGMVLAFFRHLSVKKLWIAFVVVYSLNVAISNLFDLGQLFFGTQLTSDRYVGERSLSEILSYPVWVAVVDYIKIAISSPLGTLSKFLLGYCIAKSGIIENLKDCLKSKYLLILSGLYIGLSLIGIVFEMKYIKNIGYLFGSLCYAAIFLYIYYKTHPLFRFLEPYGKLGLTNYSLQGIVGVILMSTFFIPNNMSFEWILLSFVIFFILQVIFSIWWLKYHRYGPVEWVWRCTTALKFTSNKKQ